MRAVKCWVEPVSVNQSAETLPTGTNRNGGGWRRTAVASSFGILQRLELDPGILAEMEEGMYHLRFGQQSILSQWICTGAAPLPLHLRWRRLAVHTDKLECHRLEAEQSNE